MTKSRALLSIAFVLALAAIALSGCTSGSGMGDDGNPFTLPSGSVTIAGSGATFPKTLIEQWTSEYHRIHSNLQVSYSGVGSGKGITDITAKNVIFAGSDAPLKTSDRDAAPGIIEFPETLGAICIVYNANIGGAALRLDGPTIADIYLGNIQKWNDAKIQALNPGVTLPSDKIGSVHRSDSSGTTYVFTDFLQATSPAWKTTMGGATKAPAWEKATGASPVSGAGNDGVAKAVKDTPNTIGYVELSYAGAQKLSTVSVKNKDGLFVSPSNDGASKAGAAFADKFPKVDGDWSSFSIVNAPGPDSYPISTFTYMLVYKTRDGYGGKYSADEYTALRAFLWWAIHGGQSFSESLGYAKLPPAAVKLGEDALKGMTG